MSVTKRQFLKKWYQMPDFHQPACQLADHADGVPAVPLLDHGLFQDLDGNGVVVLDHVMKVDHIAGANVMKLYFFVTAKLQNCKTAKHTAKWLKCLSQASLTFSSKAGAYPSEHLVECPYKGRSLAHDP